MNSKNLLQSLDLEKKSTTEDISQVEAKLGAELPGDFKEFLLTHNGGEGFINEEYIIFWCTDDLIQFNKHYEVSEYAPGLFLFGSNGGGEAYAYDLRESPPIIVMVPFIGMSLKYATALARNFEEFLIYLADQT